MDPDALKQGQLAAETGGRASPAASGASDPGFVSPPTEEMSSETSGERQQDTTNRRRYDRVTVLWSGKLLYGNEAVNCLIVNISAEGAMVQISDPLAVGTPVILKNERLGAFAGKVAWENDQNHYGLQFLDDKDEIAQVLGLILP